MITLNRGETTSIPFSITDSYYGSLMGKRVTYAFGTRQGKRVMSKAGALPGSSADITITAQNPDMIAGTINMLAADYATLSDGEYHATLWIDDGTGTQQCVTPGGFDTVKVTSAVPRS